MYKLAIFDLDGTLLDTIKDLSIACNVALEHFGYSTHSIEQYKTYVGNGIYKLIERAVPEDKKDEASVLAVKAVFDDYYKAHSEDYTKPYEGIIELLEALQKQGIKCAVATNKAHVYATELVERIFGNRIHKVLGQREGIPTKPEPIIVEELMDYFNVAKTECIYIGDSNVDMWTAQNAGVNSVGILWGFRSKEELQEAGAHYLVASTKELYEVITL